jgi:hypothetical protein
MSRRLCALAFVASWALACGPGSKGADWPPLAKKWYDRALASFRRVDVEDADLAIQNARRLEPNREEVRLLAARIALARLEFDEAVKALAGLTSSEARAIRGRAYWYAGRVTEAADELEQLLVEPDVKDPWAREVAKLSRRGTGREPFRMSGALVGVSAMPEVGPGAALIVPIELNGEPVLGLIATGTPEVMVDSTSREPSWVSLRFGERVEVKDVPALPKDLSGVSKQLNAPIKVLLGVNLLRHLRPTIDYHGSQFVVRTYDPPPPPRSTTLKPAYVRGGGMVFRAALSRSAEDTDSSLLVDTSMFFPIALDDAAWTKAGVDPSRLQPLPAMAGLRHGMLPYLRIGAYEIPDVPGVSGAPLAEFEKGLDIDLDGLVGSGLLAAFRVTLTDGGRTLWLEDNSLLNARPPNPDGVLPDMNPNDLEAPAGAPAPAPDPG